MRKSTSRREKRRCAGRGRPVPVPVRHRRRHDTRTSDNGSSDEEGEEEDEGEEDGHAGGPGISTGQQLLLGMRQSHDMSTSKQYIARCGARVTFFAEVTPVTIGRLLCLLQEASALVQAEREQNRPGFVDGCIELTIASEGGCSFSGLMAHDALVQLKTPVRAIVAGQCCSAATLILLACEERCMLPHSFLLVHDIWYGITGTRAVVEREVINTRMMSEKYRSIYLARSSLDEAALDAEMSHDGILDAAASLRAGLVDRVLTPARASRRPRMSTMAVAEPQPVGRKRGRQLA